MRSLDAILVDFDGTLVDSEFANAKAYSVALSEYGVSASAEEVAAVALGRHWSSFLPELVGGCYSAELGGQIAEAKKRVYPALFGEIRVNWELVLLLRALRGVVATALVTNASRSSVAAILAALGLDGLFDVLVCQEDIAHPKPDPQPYLVALSRLGLPSGHCLAIEDSDVGVQAALAANLPVWRVVSFR